MNIKYSARSGCSIFYINKDFTIKDPGPFVFANSVFLRKSGCKNTIKVNIPSLHLMEGSAIAGIAAHLGHNAGTVCCIIAHRHHKASNPDYKPQVRRLIELCLEKLAEA